MIFGMTVRTRVTVSLPAELVQRVDRQARARRTTRSAIVAQWLQAGARQEASAALDAAITAYYSTSSVEEAREADAIARAAGAATRSLDLDGIAAARPKSKHRKSA